MHNFTYISLMHKKSFNTTGPCMADMHYMLSPVDRIDAAKLQRFIDEKLYWVLHAPRQTGKTSFLLNWMEQLNAQPGIISLYVSVETCQGIADMDTAMSLVCESIKSRAELHLPVEYWPEIPEIASAGKQLHRMLQSWAQKFPDHGLVLLFDEVDVLEGPAMISFLRQIRDGFSGRGKGKFPISIALVGMRDLRDYLVYAKDGVPVNPGSPFNVKKESFTLQNFEPDEVNALLSQHTTATGQIFTDDARELLYHYSCGQPWLVNSLADFCVSECCPQGEDITAAHIEQAKEKLIERREVHIDSLAERLKEPRIRQVVEPILIGKNDPELATRPGFEFSLDLGLITIKNGTPQIANPIYREVLIRSLNYGQQLAIPAPEFKWQKDNGDLDIEALMEEFQTFWRRNGDLWEQKFDYTEAFPHLLLMAYFQRIVNGGARLTRKAAAGRGRIDMLVEWKQWSHLVEIKLVHPHDGRATTLAEGLKQIAFYADKVKPDTQHLVIFDRSDKGRAMSFEDKMYRENLEGAAGPLSVWWF